MHNGQLEYFRPFEVTTVAQFAPLSVLQEVSKNFALCESPALVKQIIVATSLDGRIKVFYQIIELSQ